MFPVVVFGSGPIGVPDFGYKTISFCLGRLLGVLARILARFVGVGRVRRWLGSMIALRSSCEGVHNWAVFPYYFCLFGRFRAVFRANFLVLGF